MKAHTTTVLLSCLALSVCTTQADTITLDWEGETANSASNPAGWSYVDSGLGGSGTYVTSAAGGGSTGAGVGGVLVSPNGTHGTNLPYSFLVNSGSANGFDVSQAITGTYDHMWTNTGQYDTAGFLFGDIKDGTIDGSDAGQLLMISHAQGGFGQATAESRITDGANVSTYAPTSNAGYADNTWYRSSFTWTPTAGLTGDLSYISQRWNGSAWVAHSTFGITGHTFDSPEAYFGLADMWASTTTFDNVSITGTAYAVPEPSSLALLGLGGLLIARRRRS